MLNFDLVSEQSFDPRRHVEKVLGRVPYGDVSVACWEPGHTSPYHCHPNATEIYYCVSGGGTMRTPEREVPVTPGGFVLHPPGELHEYVNGDERSVLFRIRVGEDMASRTISWDRNADWRPSDADRAYFDAVQGRPNRIGS